MGPLARLKPSKTSWIQGQSGCSAEKLNREFLRRNREFKTRIRDFGSFEFLDRTGMAQEEMARRLRVDPGTLARWERGKGIVLKAR